MSNEADISRGSDHFHGDILYPWPWSWRRWLSWMEPREIVIQRGGTRVEAKFEFKAGRSVGTKRRRINLRVPG